MQVNKHSTLLLNTDEKVIGDILYKLYVCNRFIIEVGYVQKSNKSRTGAWKIEFVCFPQNIVNNG